MEDKDENLIYHIKELRNVLIKSFICIGIFLPFCLWMSPKMLNFFINTSIGDSGISLNYFSPMEIFLLQLKIAIFAALILSFPYIAKVVWDFILPALYDKEKQFIKSIVFSSSFLFVSGILFCFFLIIPLIIKFGLSFSSEGINALFGVSDIVNLSLNLCLVFGIMFQFPLITFSLIRSGIISYDSVKSKRPYVFVTILILSALLTPPDIISQLMLSAPTYMLFEIGLFAARKNNKKTD